MDGEGGDGCGLGESWGNACEMGAGQRGEEYMLVKYCTGTVENLRA